MKEWQTLVKRLSGVRPRAQLIAHGLRRLFPVIIHLEPQPKAARRAKVARQSQRAVRDHGATSVLSHSTNETGFPFRRVVVQKLEADDVALCIPHHDDLVRGFLTDMLARRVAQPDGQGVDRGGVDL